MYNKSCETDKSGGVAALEKRMELNLLLDFYGPLLTEQRQKVLSLYCEEDMSLQEIAETMGITRQAVHDAIARASEQLNDYESKLGTLRRYRKTQTEMNSAIEQLGAVVATEGTQRALDGALAALKNIDWIEE